MRLVYLSLAWITGLYLGLRYNVPMAVPAILSGITVMAIFVSRRRKTLLWSGVCLLLLFGGIIRSSSVPEGDHLQSYRGLCELEAIISADPDSSGQSTVLRLKAQRINIDGKWERTSGSLQVYATPIPEFESRDPPYYRYGDLIRLRGRIDSPESPSGDDDFDFGAYLARQGIHSIMYSPTDVELLSAGHESLPLRLIYKLKWEISHSLEHALPEPQCALVRAMLLGERGSIPPEVKEDFARAGTSHLLAISGVHVSIVAGLALSAGVWVCGRRRPTYFILALSVVWLYVTLSGMSPSAIRAATMGSLWLYAEWIGRQRSAFNALAFAAMIMLALSPRLMSEIGFQLSFAAMSGLIFITPPIQNRAREIFGKTGEEVNPAMNFVINSFAVTMGAVLATLPLIAFYFHQVSMMSVPSTFLTLPAVPGIIVSAAGTGIVGIFSPGAASLTGWVTWLLTSYVNEVVHFFSTLPFASVNLNVQGAEVSGYYISLAVILWLPRNRARLKGRSSKVNTYLKMIPRIFRSVSLKWVILSLLMVTILVWTAAVTVADTNLHVHFLDVGQGDSILIRKGNQQILVDGGPDGKKMTAELGDKMPFWDRTIELVVLTHPDGDHITGLIDILRRYKVEKVLTSGQKHDSALYREWRRLLDEKNIDLIVACPGQEIILKNGGRLLVLHPAKDWGETHPDLNSNSVTLRLEYGNFSMLLTGDIDVEAEEHLLRGDSVLKSNVLKVSHHGSDTASSPPFLDRVKPRLAVISVGQDNKFGHPVAEIMKRLEKQVGPESLYLTSEDGAVELITDGSRLWVKTAE